MTDLLDRIRRRANDAPLPTEYMLDEAADEIERLREVLSKAATALLDVANGGLWGLTNEEASLRIREHCRTAGLSARDAARTALADENRP